MSINPTALRTVKTPLSFGHSECNRVNVAMKIVSIVPDEGRSDDNSVTFFHSFP